MSLPGLVLVLAVLVWELALVEMAAAAAMVAKFVSRLATMSRQVEQTPQASSHRALARAVVLADLMFRLREILGMVVASPLVLAARVPVAATAAK